VCLTVFVCLSQCVCISQCVILFLSVDVSLSLSVCVCLSLYVYVSKCVYVSVSQPSGRGLMGNPFGRGKARARMELAKALRSIFDRLEHLETLPPPTLSPHELDAARAALRGGLDERLGDLETRFQGLESDIETWTDKIKKLTFGVEEGIQRTDRAERRIHATIKRARKELAEHGYESPGLEVEAAELRLVDGAGSVESGVRAVPEDVEGGVDPASSIKGVPAETLRRVRGY